MFEHNFFYLIVVIINTFIIKYTKYLKKIIILDIPDKSCKIHKNPTPLLWLLIYLNIVTF